MYCSFGLWLHCIVDFQLLIHVSICVCFCRTHFVHLIRRESVSLRKVNGDAGRAAFNEPRSRNFCTSNSGVSGWGCWRSSVISTQPRFLSKVTRVEFVGLDCALTAEQVRTAWDTSWRRCRPWNGSVPPVFEFERLANISFCWKSCKA
jgi:hypothetical protein